MLKWLRRSDAPKRVAVIQALPVEGRRSVVLVRRDNVEHLVLVGGRNDLVIESNIIRRPAPNLARRPSPERQRLPPPGAPTPEPLAEPDEAKPSQILISPRVRQAVEKAVTVESVGEFELKGLRRPMLAYNVPEPSPSKPN